MNHQVVWLSTKWLSARLSVQSAVQWSGCSMVWLSNRLAVQWSDCPTGWLFRWLAVQWSGCPMIWLFRWLAVQWAGCPNRLAVQWAGCPTGWLTGCLPCWLSPGHSSIFPTLRNDILHEAIDWCPQ